MANLRIGTSGWNYPGGAGTWNGVFYPSGQGRGSKRRGGQAFDELAFYAEHFDTVEINTTFYGPPRPEVAFSWANRTPDGFEFSLKLHRHFTHERGDTVDAEQLDGFRRGIEPLANA